MLTSLLSDETFVNWLGILLLTIMMLSYAIVFEGVHYFSNKIRNFSFYMSIASTLGVLILLFYIVTK